MSKQKVPEKLKEMVWTHYMGETFHGKCYCCFQIITPFQWHAAHVIPSSRGGPMTQENLRPTCAKCNLSMNAKHMEDFVHDFDLPGKIYFPKQKIIQVGNTLILRKS